MSTCLQRLQLGQVCGCGEVLCDEYVCLSMCAVCLSVCAVLCAVYVCLVQNGMGRHLLEPVLAILVCTCFSLGFSLSWCATIATGLVVILSEADRGRQLQAEVQAGCLTTSRRSPPGLMLMRPVPAAALQHPHGIPGPAWGQTSPNRSLRVLPDQLTGMPQEGADHKGGQSGREGVQQ